VEGQVIAFLHDEGDRKVREYRPEALLRKFVGDLGNDDYYMVTGRGSLSIRY